jgi:branched-chain amino acid transport system permease protein
MVSFGHAVFIGIGGYCVAILGMYGVNNGFVEFGVAIGVSAIIAAIIGSLSLRTSGVYFIMITLAFAQMFYLLGMSLEKFGGDEGLNIDARAVFAGLPPLGGSVAFYYFVFGVLAVLTALAFSIVESRFGMVLTGAKLNERRMRAIGFPTTRYKLVAFVIAGAMCGIAGALLANQALFVSPEIMNWGRSGEIMIMVIMGGMGTLIGPILGAVAYVILEDTLSGFSQHWQIFLGFILLFQILFFRWGILGLVIHPWRRRLHVQRA